MSRGNLKLITNITSHQLPERLLCANACPGKEAGEDRKRQNAVLCTTSLQGPKLPSSLPAFISTGETEGLQFPPSCRPDPESFSFALSAFSPNPFLITSSYLRGEARKNVVL